MIVPYKFNVGSYEYEVFFERFLMQAGKSSVYQWGTTCLLRCLEPLHNFWGNTIENPNDKSSKEEGERWAYRRAVDAMILHERCHHNGNPDPKKVWRTFRRKLYNARIDKALESDHE